MGTSMHTTSLNRVSGFIAATLCALFCGACSGGPRASFESRDPQERTLAVVDASTRPTLSDESIEDLIGSLESVDPAARLLSIETLERHTGETFGYRYFDPQWKRDEAVARWVAWWSRRSGGDADSSGGVSG